METVKGEPPLNKLITVGEAGGAEVLVGRKILIRLPGVENAQPGTVTDAELRPNGWLLTVEERDQRIRVDRSTTIIILE